MARLKTHPREEAANRLLLRRAERAYQELPLEAREMLGELLDGFEAALGMQGPAAVERHREALQEFLDLHDVGGGPTQDGNDDDWYRP
jgi:molecular chaperone HscC